MALAYLTVGSRPKVDASNAKGRTMTKAFEFFK